MLFGKKFDKSDQKFGNKVMGALAIGNKLYNHLGKKSY